MNSIEDRLRDAMAARAETVGDDHHPLPAPQSRRASVRSPIRIAAVALAVAVTAFGVIRLVAPSSGPQEESIFAMSLSGTAPSGTPDVAVFLCKDDDPFPSCKGGGITKTERENLQRALEARPEVDGVAFENRQQVWENFRRQNEDDDPELVKAITPKDMPESFRARIRAGADFSAVARAASELPGVSNSVDQACLLDNSYLWGAVKMILGLGEQCSFMGKER
jgi:ferric-dicitrate binding protein FerR (iron transport regulator)